MDLIDKEVMRNTAAMRFSGNVSQLQNLVAQSMGIPRNMVSTVPSILLKAVTQDAAKC